MKSTNLVTQASAYAFLSVRRDCRAARTRKKQTEVCVTLLAMFASLASGQTSNPLRMEILLEKEDHGKATVMEPGHVFESGDHLRFRFTPNFSGTLFVQDRGTSGSYTLLFPKEDSGTDDKIEAGKTYLLPSVDKGWFRVTGPAGHDIVYFVVTSAKAGAVATSVPLPHLSPPGEAPPAMTPRCNDELFRARGDCIDLSAGPKGARDLFIIRKDKASVVSSPEPPDGPVVYEFHVAHK